MAKFIKVSIDDRPAILNVDHITAVIRGYNGQTHIYMNNESTPYEVDQSVEEVQNLLRHYMVSYEDEV